MLREMVVPAGRKATFKMLEDAAAQGPEYFLRERNWAAMKEGVGQFGLAIAHSADDPMVTAAEAGATRGPGRTRGAYTNLKDSDGIWRTCSPHVFLSRSPRGRPRCDRLEL